jgi:hypothetical protein
MSWNITPCNHSNRNAAVERCCHARNRAIFAAREAQMDRITAKPQFDGRSREDLEHLVSKQDIFTAGYYAFMSELPDLDSPATVYDYTACISHGMALDIIDPAIGPKLLYSAQIILSAKRSEPKPAPAPKPQTAA